MGKTIGIIIGVIVLVAGAGAGGFYGGTVYERQQVQNTRNAFFNSRGGTGGTGGTGGGAGGGGGFGGGVFGTVKSISGNTLQLSTPQNVTTVTLSGSTTVMKTVAGTTADLQVGDTITVRGQRDASGNVTATTIQLLPAGTTFPGRGGGNDNGGAGGGGNATQAP